MGLDEVTYFDPFVTYLTTLTLIVIRINSSDTLVNVSVPIQQRYKMFYPCTKKQQDVEANDELQRLLDPEKKIPKTK